MNATRDHLEENVIASFCAQQHIMPAKAVAALIGVKPETESQMRARRQSPTFFKSGSAVFYRFELVAAWILQQRVEAERGGTGQRRAVRDILG